MASASPSRIALFLLTLAALAPSCGRSETAELTDLERRWGAAIEKHDTAFLDRLLVDEYTDVTFRGAVRSKLSVLSGPPAGGRYHTIRLEGLRVRVYGWNAAVVTGVNVLRGAAPGDSARVAFTDVFVRRHGRWRAVSSQETLQTGP
ncbi:MAG TPA: nuclear transport factor 2 family protein [Candidatus Eisenbacteria bacterium]